MIGDGVVFAADWTSGGALVIGQGTMMQSRSRGPARAPTSTQPASTTASQPERRGWETAAC